MSKKTSKEYEIGFRIAADMEADFVKTFSSAAKSVEGVQDELKALQRQKWPGDMTREFREGMKKSRDELVETSGAFGDFKDRLKNVAEYTGAYKLVSGVADSFTDVIGATGEYQTAMKQIQAATGTSSKEMADMQKMVEKLYDQNLGEDFKDLADSISKARQVTGLQGEALEQTTKHAIAYRDIFGEDLAASLKAVDTMTKNFGVTSEQAFNLLAQGAQQGLDKTGELLDTANEYTPYFAKLGFDANQMFDTFASGLEAGAFNLDKVGDGIKEFGIRTKDGSEQSLKAYEALKLNGQDMTKEFAAGGEAAQKAFLKTVKAINSVEDPAEKNVIAVQLFGTQAEDLEDRVIKAYGNIQKQFDMTKSTMEEITAVKYDTTALSFQGLGRELMTEFVLPVSEELLPKLQELAEWLADNKGLVKNAAMALAAGGTVKGLAKVTGNIAEMTAATATGGKSLGLLRSALGLTSPVGIAVAAVGGATLAFAEFKRQQEKAREELLNMGQSLKTAYDDYQGIQNQTQLTKDLIIEYDTLKGKIGDVNTPSEELAKARERLMEVEEKLIELNPDILKAEDAKSGKFREQLGLADRLNDTRNKAAKRDLEKAAIDNETKLPELQKEYERLSDNLKTYNQAYSDAKESYVKYQEYVSQQQSISQNLSGAEQANEMQQLMNQIREETGKYYASGDMLGVTRDMVIFKDQFDDAFDSIRNTEQDIATAKDSFQAIYDTQKEMIEMNLGAELEEQAQKFNSLSDAEQVRFKEALESVFNLNKELDMLPAEKQVDVKLLYKNVGFEVPKEYSDFVKYPFSTPKSMPMFAEGGIATRPSIFGEAGPEMAIPLNNRARSRELLERTNQLMGYDTHSVGDFVLNITNHFTGNVDQNTIEQMEKRNGEQFRREFEKFKQHLRRVSMGT